MSETRTESVREALEAAFDTVERDAPPAPRPVSRETRPETRDNRANGASNRAEPRETAPEAPETAETEPETEPEASERGVDRPRDQFGRFLSSTPPAARAARPQGDRAEAPDEAEPDTETDLPDQPEPEAQEPDAPAILAPQAWSAAAKDEWHRLPRAIQEEVDRRERDVSRAFQQRAEQTNVLEPIAEAIRPYQQKLALRGTNAAAAVGQLLAVQDILERDPINGVAYVARQYGVDLRQFSAAFQQSQQPQDPAVRELAQRVAQQDQTIQSWQRAAEAQQQAVITDEVQRFAADTRNYPYFEHVRPRMAELMATGGATTLAQAYRLACADNDQISAAMAHAARSAELAQRQASEKQAADRARRAAVSVRGAPYGGGGGGSTAKPRTLKEELYHSYDNAAGTL